MRIVRLVIIARIAKVVEIDFLHLSGDLVVWTSLINTAAISLLLLDLVIDYSWMVMYAVGGAARKEFATMLARIKAREAELQDKIQLLTIEIDHARAAKEVDSIESDPIFQKLKSQSGSLRDRLKGN